MSKKCQTTHFCPYHSFHYSNIEVRLQSTMETVTSSLKTAEEALAKPVKVAAKTATKVMVAPSSSYREYSWEELKSIEKRRRAILLRTEEPFWGILSHWDGTVLAILLQDSLLWMTILIYIGMRVWARYGIPSFVAQLGSGSNITVIGGFVSFFLVFYVNQNHKRYFNLYSKSMACKGRIFDVATIAVTSTLPKSVSTRLVRYMNAAHVAGYTGLSQTYPSSSFFMHLNKDLGLLTKEELSRMEDIDLDKGGSCQRELIAWSMMEIQKCHKEGIIDNELAVQLREQILQLRAAFGQLFNAADLPIPFFYVHFVCLLSAFYLPLFAISGAYNAGTGNEVHWTADVVSGLVVVLNSIFVIGLRILGQKMSDPYGDDLIDLSVIFYCTFTWRMSNRVLNTQFPSDDASESVEQELVEYRSETIGKAFEADITVDTPSSSSSDDDEDNGDSDDFDNDGLPINQREDGMERNQPKSARFQFPRRGGGP